MDHAPVIYYFPGHSAAAGSMFGSGLQDIPPAYRPKFIRHTKVGPATGPDKARGTLITNFENVLVMYEPEHQTWRRIGPDIWCGLRTGYTSEALAKPAMLGRGAAMGYPVTLGDGRRYIIPVALADAPNYDIPWTETFDEAGAIIRQVAAPYEQLCMVAQRLFDAITDDGEFCMDEADVRRACAAALSVNYNLDLTDCLALGLFTSETYRAIISAILDFTSLPEMVKKKAAAASGTNSGVPAPCPTTAPHTQTSNS